ncbi:MAG: YidC/Oxa1 family insertase periplasmic-domain containing protein [Planctomycetota bacterium]
MTNVVSAAGLAWLGLGLCSSTLAAQEPQGGANLQLSNETFRVELATAGAVPVGWSVRDDTPGGTGGDNFVDLLDPGAIAATTFRPLALVLPPLPDGGVPAADQRVYEVSRADTPTELVVTLTAPPDASGLQFIKTYRLVNGQHVAQLRVEVHNSGDVAQTLDHDGRGLGITLGPGLGYSATRKPELFGEGWVTSILGFYKGPDGVFSVDVPSEEPRRADVPETGGAQWGGVHSQYFTMVLVPETDGAAAPFVSATIAADTSAGFGDRIGAEDLESYPCVTLFHPPLTLAPGASHVYAYSIYAGPKDRELLQASGLEIEPILFHHLWDWLAWLCKALETALAALNSVFNSWGWSIIVFAVLFRVITMPLSLYGAKHQMLMKRKMTALKPEVAAIKEKHKSNSDTRNEAILALYKKNGINPLSQSKGCLPLLIQLPVMVALFQLLLNSYELRGASFMWIDDLTLTDRLAPLGFELPWLGSYFNVLPLIMFVAQVIIAKSMSSSTEPGEGGAGPALLLLPVAMTILLYPFPSGCMLFWTTGNILQVAEQRLATSYVRKMS